MALTPKQEDFAAGIAEGLSQAEAYRRAFPRSQKWKDETVWREASRLAGNTKVSTRVQELHEQAVAKNEVTVERVVSEMAGIALFDPKLIFDADGKLLPVPQWPDEA